ncbi:hypothetical protein KIPB_012106, partial [Kipferlia bialata]|eukprot:g12106.t1
MGLLTLETQRPGALFLSDALQAYGPALINAQPVVAGVPHDKVVIVVDAQHEDTGFVLENLSIGAPVAVEPAPSLAE